MLLMMAVFLLFLFMGAPIVFSFAFASIVYVLQHGMENIVPPIFYSSLDSFSLLAIPFFIYAGDLMSNGGISVKLLELSRTLIGRVKGYLGSITIVASAFFAAISGSGLATVAAVGKIMIPEMIRHGYPRGYAAVLMATASILGPIIPPSVPMVLFAFVSGASVLKLFLGGILPGLLLALGLLILNRMYVRRFTLTENANANPDPSGPASRALEIWHAGRRAILALLMPVIIIGGIYSGIFTATEAAVVSVVYAILIGFLFYRELNWKTFFQATISTVNTTAFILITLVFASIFSRILTIERVPLKIVEFLTGSISSPELIVLIIVLFLLVVGMFIDLLTAVIIVTPVVLPVAQSIGMDLAHFGVLLCVTLCVGSITPPMAINLYLSAQIAEASVKDQMKYLTPFIVIAVVVVFLIAYIPGLVLWIPGWLT
jgi:C4-dicarboxylate transporter DctM subunit